MRRRDFVSLLAAASAVAWPPAANAQQAGKIARLGYLASILATGARSKLSCGDCVTSAMSRAAMS